jgi:hypothetical protein
MSRLKGKEMGRVFVPEPRQLFAPKAEPFGQIVPLVPAESKLGLEPDRIKSLVAKGLTTFDDDDYLLLDGSNTHCAVATSVVGIERNSINLLLWNSMSNNYVFRRLDLEDLPIPVFSGQTKRVFMTNDIHGITPEGYEAISLTSGNDPDIMEPDKIKRKMLEMLIHSQPTDFLLLSGSKIHNAVASVIISRLHGSVNYMIWNARTKEYVLRSCKYTLEDLQRILSL